MAPLSIPVIEEKITRIIALTAHHTELARTAQNNEETFGDLAVESETKTEYFMATYPQLKNAYNSYVALYNAGRLHPTALNAFMLLVQYHFDAETKNTEAYERIIALEGYYDIEHHRHDNILSDLELHHIVFLAAKDELRLRERGVSNTPLQDVILDD